VRRLLLTPFAACLVALYCSSAAAAQDPVVTTVAGKLRGRITDGIATFKGVPYAAPPVGALRWKETMPVPAWPGIRDASDYGAPCAQGDRKWNTATAAISQEDCLYLNIWTPAAAQNDRLAVMVFLPGGANMGGSARGDTAIEPSYEGAKLAARGVVVVTVNYRVGVFGFLAHPELTAESPHRGSGNYGLFDQRAALKWVRDNISAFGGDPARMTAFGQSAGSANIGALMTSPLGKDLFARAILMSNSVLDVSPSVMTLAEGEASGRAIAERLGAPAHAQVAFLRAMPAQKLLRAVAGQPGQEPPPPLEWVIDGYLLREWPGEVFRRGGELPIPIIIGATARDGDLPSMGVKGSPKAAAALENLARAQSRGGSSAVLTDEDKQTIRAFYAADSRMADQAVALYESEPSTDPGDGDKRIEFNTDIRFRCGASIIASWHARRAATWEYQFSHGYEPLGAVHLWDLQYLFGYVIAPADQSIDRQLSDAIQRYWTTFAKTGDPNESGLISWPNAKRNASYLDFTSEGAVAKMDLRRAACQLFERQVTAELDNAASHQRTH